MSSTEHVPNELAILLDGTQLMFSDRLMQQLHSSGLEIQKLNVASGIAGLVKLSGQISRSRAKIVHYLWGAYDAPFYIVPKLLGKKVIVHWLGSDVLSATSNNNNASCRILQRRAYKMADLHLVVSPTLMDELKTICIEATVIPLVPDVPPLKKDVPWPSAHKVYVYLPEAKQEFYGADAVFRLAQEMPDTDFLITGHSGTGAPQLPNLKYLSWVEDIEAVWREVKVYLRLTKHDGLPQALVEALSRGKYVVWSYELPHCLRARSFEEAREALNIALAKDHPNVAGMSYALSEFDPSRIAQNLRQRYLQLVS